MHALIIEPDAWVALMIEDALRDLGFNSFDIASSGEEAFALAARQCPDLITSDVRLPSCNGIETVRTICADRYIPVVFITETGWEVRERSADLPLVQKPFASHQLKDAIGKAINQPPPAW